jgi:GNAT superfamily N-acetyltransferase
VGDLEVRLVAAADLELVAGLRRAWTEEQLGEPVDDAGYEDRFAAWWAAEADRRLLWVATVAGEPVGMLNVTVFERMPRPDRPPSRWGYLGNAFVLRRHRNSGIGAVLLDAAVSHAREAGFVRLVLAPGERSVPFYGRAGFRPANDLMLLELN